MRSRQNIVEIFSTFLQFEADRISRWVTDPKLRRNMEHHLTRVLISQISEDFWALYWYKVWQSQPLSLARAHLTAYLQESCYWASQKIAASNFIAHYTISDYFQIGIEQIDKVLKGFNPGHGFTLKIYASTVFSNGIRENLRQRHEADICTPWALLRKLSQKRLIESLQTTGLTAEMIAAYVKAWKCFKTICVPEEVTATRKLSRPDNQTWNAIACLYNAQTSGSPRCNPEVLEKWLLTCAKVARAYLYPNLTSINTLNAGQESGEVLDILPADELESLIEKIITQEEQQKRDVQTEEINAVLLAAIAQLEPQAQSLLRQYYSQELTQQEIAQQLTTNQYTISRKLNKSRRLLLHALAKWSKETLHISPDSDTLKNISIVLEEWLRIHYSHSCLTAN